MKKLSRKTYVMSDPHFWHNNIIKYCNRPYEATDKNDLSNIDELERMNEDIMKEFDNLPVGVDIYLLGDIFFVGESHKSWLLDRFETLCGYVSRMKNKDRKVYLILGNHDNLHFSGQSKLAFYYSLGFDAVYDTPVIIEDNIILSHEPVYIQKGSNFKNLYGHTHDLSIEADYFTYDFDNYAMERRVAKQHGLPEPELIQKWPDKMIDLNNYVNCCWDANHKFLEVGQFVD